MDPVTLVVVGGVALAGAQAIPETNEDRQAPDGPDGTDPATTNGSTADPGIPIGDTRTMNYSASSGLWLPIIGELCGDQPVEFHGAWVQRESNWNPGAVGSIHASGPDGYAREMGLYQLYNPDELVLAGVTSAQLRAGCAAPTGTQVMVRALTSDEMATHVRAGVNYIAKRRNRADGDLAKVGASWNEQDTWRLVKLYHALTGLPYAALRATTDRLGRAPSGWIEMRDTLTGCDLTPYGGASLARYKPYGDYTAGRGPLPNAEAVGGAVAA